jgi:cell wall-associated NlpC family hydrolase
VTLLRLVETGRYTDNFPVRAPHLLLPALALLLGACASTGGVPRPFPGAALPPTAAPAANQPAAVEAPPPAVDASAQEIVATALALQGVRYRNGGSDPSGFDCSGFVQWTFNQNGLRLPREVRTQSQVGTRVDLASVEPGDLLFFETVSRGPSHVGIAIGGGEFVHAPSSRGVVRVERYDSSYWARRFLEARRVRSRTTDTR